MHLLDEGIDVNQVNKGHNNCLHGASVRAEVDILEILLNAGADVHTRNYDGNIPFVFVCMDSGE